MRRITQIPLVEAEGLIRKPVEAKPTLAICWRSKSLALKVTTRIYDHRLPSLRIGPRAGCLGVHLKVAEPRNLHTFALCKLDADSPDNCATPGA